MAILQSFYLMRLRSLRVILNNEIRHILTFFLNVYAAVLN